MPISTSLHSHPVRQGRRQVAVTPASVAAATTVEQTVTVTGVRPGDQVSVTAPGHVAGIGLGSARVAVNDVVRVTWINTTAGALTPPAGTYTFLWAR